MEETPARETSARETPSRRRRRITKSAKAPKKKKVTKVTSVQVPTTVHTPPATSAFHGFVSVQARGTVALPPTLRKRYGLDKPGAQVELTERADGVLELRPTIAVPASEAWFWDERWQAGERDADADIAAGRSSTFTTAQDFISHLERIDQDARAHEAASQG